MPKIGRLTTIITTQLVVMIVKLKTVGKFWSIKIGLEKQFH